MAPQGSDRSRIESLEKEVMQLRQLINQSPLKVAQPNTLPRGLYLGVTRDDHEAGDEVRVDIWFWYLQEGKWKRVQKYIAAKDWFMNPDDVVLKGTRVAVVWYFNVWVVLAAYCTPVPEDEEPPPNQGDYGETLGPVDNYIIGEQGNTGSGDGGSVSGQFDGPDVYIGNF